MNKNPEIQFRSPEKIKAYQEKDPKVEAVADDLASLILDAKMEQEGFARSSINPFLFPGEGE